MPSEAARLIALGHPLETTVDLDTALTWMRGHYGLSTGPILSSEQPTGPAVPRRSATGPGGSPGPV